MVRIVGLEEFEQKLRQLREEVGNKDTGGVLYGSLMYASTPMYNQIRAKAPSTTSPYRRYMSYAQGVRVGGKRRRARRGTGRYQMQDAGLYKKSIKRRRLTKGHSANLDGAAIAIYVAEGSGKTFGSAYYWFFNEFGTKYQAPQPIFRPTFDSGNAEAESRFAKKLGERIDKVMGGS